MAVYNKDGSAISVVYNSSGASLSVAYDSAGNVIFSGEEPWNPTTLAYDTNFLITDAWLENATTQRDAVKTLYQSSADAIPFFIMTDGHGRYNEGNKGCHNLAEETMRYIPNLMLGDYASYYNYGANPTNHTSSSTGIEHYLPVMGNHEFMSYSDGDIADLSLMVSSYVPTGATAGSSTYGYYKYLDNAYNIKWLVGQPYIPDDSDSSGFVTYFNSAQWEWFIDEMEADDGYDIVILNHQPFAGTYTLRSDASTVTYTGGNWNLAPVIADFKARTSGTVTDYEGVTHSYDFTSCTKDILCTFHGHIHKEEYMDKTQYGYPSYIGKDFTGVGDSCYGLIDRENGKLYIYAFTRSSVSEALVLDL